MDYVQADFTAMEESAKVLETNAKNIQESISKISASVKYLEEDKKFCSETHAQSLITKFSRIEKSYEIYTTIINDLATALRNIIQNYNTGSKQIAELLDAWEPAEPNDPNKYNAVSDGVKTVQENINNYKETIHENIGNMRNAAQQNAANTADYLDRVADSYGDTVVGKALSNVTKWFSGGIRKLFKVDTIEVGYVEQDMPLVQE